MCNPIFVFRLHIFAFDPEVVLKSSRASPGSTSACTWGWKLNRLPWVCRQKIPPLMQARSCRRLQRYSCQACHALRSNSLPSLRLRRRKGNSWHRDPEPLLHIPIVSNPGSLFVLNHPVTHLPAGGSAYFVDTRGYHMAMNGGVDERVHLVAALAFPPLQD